MDSLIKRLNNTEYGLASGIFTRDINRALYFAEKIDAGTVFINTYNKTDVAAPFGGFKQSGFGKDLGKLIFVYRMLTCCLECVTSRLEKRSPKIHKLSQLKCFCMRPPHDI